MVQRWMEIKAITSAENYFCPGKLSWEDHELFCFRKQSYFLSAAIHNCLGEPRDGARHLVPCRSTSSNRSPLCSSSVHLFTMLRRWLERQKQPQDKITRIPIGLLQRLDICTSGGSKFHLVCKYWLSTVCRVCLHYRTIALEIIRLSGRFSPVPWINDYW